MATARWYVVQAQPAREPLALAHLLRQGFTAYLPYLRTQRLLRGRLQPHSAPLFPGYLFVNFAADSPWRCINGTRGVRRLMCGQHDNPLPVPAGAVEAMQAAGPVEAGNGYVPGVSRLRVEAGPFMHQVGLYVGDAGARVKVLLGLLGGEVLVQVPVGQVSEAA